MTELITSKTPELIEKVVSYLSGNIGHDDIRDYAWSFTDHAPKETPIDEQPFWSCVFTIIHLADQEHWDDGCTKRDLEELLLKLKKSEPAG